jgi:GTP-binding protein HflX
VSARTGDGIDHLLRTIADRLRAMTTVRELFVPFERGDILASLHRDGEVRVETATETGMRGRARLDDAAVGQWTEFVVADESPSR